MIILDVIARLNKYYDLHPYEKGIKILKEIILG
jgi:hypothetical protein